RGCLGAMMGNNGCNVSVNGGWGSEWEGHSVHTMLLPYIDQAPLYNQFDQNMTWTNNCGTSINRTLAKTRIPAFNCPSDLTMPVDDGTNNYVWSTGPNLGWDATAGNDVGMFSRRYSKSVRDVIDG